MPSKDMFNTKRWAILIVLAAWLLPFLIASIWVTHIVGYQWVYSLSVVPDTAVVGTHLWPKKSVMVPLKEIDRIEVYRPPRGRNEGPYVRVVTRSGKVIQSTSPIPEDEHIHAVLAILPVQRQVQDESSATEIYVPKGSQ